MSSLKVISVVNQKGGMGKTAITMQLSAALSRRCRVLVVDVDPQQSRVWWAENAHRHLPFDFAGSQHPSVLARLSHLDGDYDLAIVDTPGSLEDTRMLDAVVDASDFVIVPLAPEPLAVESTMRTIQRFIEPRDVRFAVLLNRVDPRVHGLLEAWHELLDVTLGMPRFDAHVRQCTAQADAPVLGNVITTLRDNRSTQGTIWDLTMLAREMVEHLSPRLQEAR